MRGNFITDRNGENNPNYKDGRKSSRLYRIYYNMKTRCYNPKAISYKYYGLRGIEICSEWLNDFSIFRDWALKTGYRDNLTIERIDVNGDYTPSNCIWATHKVQANNLRTNRRETINGITKNLTEWSEYYRINPKTVRDRLKRGWSLVLALKTPVDTKYRKKEVVV